MRPTRDIALRAGIYLTAAISGLAAAYVLREVWHTLIILRTHSSHQWVHHLWDAPTPNDEKPSSTQPDAEPPPVAGHTSGHSLDTDEDAHTPSTSRTKSLPPLRIPPLPPLRPDAFVSIDPSSVTLSAGLNGEDGVEEEDAAQSNTSTSDSLIDVMSPHPPRVISKRRSMRAHDLFAESHMSFSDLGCLVAPHNEPE